MLESALAKVDVLACCTFRVDRAKTKRSQADPTDLAGTWSETSMHVCNKRQLFSVVV